MQNAVSAKRRIESTEKCVENANKRKTLKTLFFGGKTFFFCIKTLISYGGRTFIYGGITFLNCVKTVFPKE